MPDRLRTLVVSDFNGANLAALLTHDTAAPLLDGTAAPYGDVHGALDTAAQGDSSYDAAFVWTRPEGISPSFATLVETGTVVLADVLADVDTFAERLQPLGRRCASVVVATWQPPRAGRLFASSAMRNDTGLSNVVMRMNLHLAERLATGPGITLLDSSPWFAAADDAYDARLWYAAKIPFRSQVFTRATADVKSLLRASLGGSRKLVVLDLDDTLWGGLVGEVGWEALRLGGHDPVGEAFVDFQRTLLTLSRRGILLAVASKNDERVALTAIETHPEMVLRRRHFVGWRINWADKAENIAQLVDELNLGLSSVVFIDDSPAERARVRDAHPEVLVPEWPTSPLLYVDHLLSLSCFDAATVTAEDRQRSEMYAAGTAREAERRMTSSTDQWLRRLAVRVEVEELNARNAARAIQLLNKTNQMNLSTRRLTANELDEWLRAGQRRLWTYRVSDRFGESGLTGIASIDVTDGRATLVDFVLSCRVFGRQVEAAMLHHASREAAGLGGVPLVATLVPTAKNAPCLQFLQTSQMQTIGDHEFCWSSREPYPLPAAIELALVETEAMA